jgi:hypothetical protein
MLLIIGAAALLMASNVNCRARSNSVSSHSPPRPVETALSADVARSRERDLRWVENGVRFASYSLHSHLPYREVQAPLTFRSGMPFVQASWSGRKIECLVDTGTAQIMWPQWLQLKGRPLGVFSKTHMIGRPTQAQWIVASDISLGGFSIRDLATRVRYYWFDPWAALYDAMGVYDGDRRSWRCPIGQSLVYAPPGDD